jgi:hypothetical protein
MAAMTFMIPILPGKLEQWRRFCQALQDRAAASMTSF